MKCFIATKKYIHSILLAQGVVGGISSRGYSVSVAPIKFNTCSIQVITDHLPIFGSQADANTIMTKIGI